MLVFFRDDNGGIIVLEVNIALLFFFTNHLLIEGYVIFIFSYRNSYISIFSYRNSYIHVEFHIFSYRGDVLNIGRYIWNRLAVY